MPVKKVLIAVKTYPTISTKYEELVCTAGFTEEGEWIRIYPIQFRHLDYEQQYKKYYWIEIDLIKNTGDFRPESFRPRILETEVKVGDKIGTEDSWHERKKYALRNVYDNLETLIAEAKNKDVCRSLVTFKPTKIIDFVYEAVEREWGKRKEEAMAQMNIFASNKLIPVKKLPYKFSYIFEDVTGKRSKMMIEDWEVGALFWKYHDEKTACEKVKEKYLDDFANTKDLYFFLGTTQIHHYVSKNPFIIIGTFHPTFPKPAKQSNQLELFL